MKLLFPLHDTTYAVPMAFEPEHRKRWFVDTKTGALLFRHHCLGMHEGLLVYAKGGKTPAFVSLGHFLRPAGLLLWGRGPVPDGAEPLLTPALSEAISILNDEYRRGKWRRQGIHAFAPLREDWFRGLTERYTTWQKWGVMPPTTETGPFVALEDADAALKTKAEQRLKEQLLWVAGQLNAEPDREVRRVMAGVEMVIGKKLRLLGEVA